MLNSFESIRITASIAVRANLTFQLEKLKAIRPQTPEIAEMIQVVKEMLEMQEALIRKLQALSIAEQLLIRPRATPVPTKKPGL